jgi:outer membrane cobalamin receptor
LGNQEFPEVLNTTPSVYATKSGGGFGDSKINIRGFAQENVAVMINGVPVNDMENGAVYWSNWAGLSDVTSAMQVQRGLGSSKLAIASVGGTINVVTRAADKKQGGIVSIGVANDDYLKTLFAYNSGKMSTGWSTSFLLSRTAGNMYANGTEFEGYNYYWALGYQNGKHDFQFTITGAPQWHNQRSSFITIANYIKYGGVNGGDPNRKYNADWGLLNGEEYSMRRNYYHKPVMSLNWDWNISSASKLNTVVYASFGRGGGTGDTGSVGGKNFSNAAWRLPDGTANFDAIYAANAASTPTAGVLVRRASINSHNWFGIISSFNQKINDNLKLTAGIDGRYYYGYHYQVVSDFLGATGFRDTTNKNAISTSNPTGQRIIVNSHDATPTWNPFGGKIDPEADMISYWNDGEVLWYGGFGQLEYSNDNLSAFVQGAVSNQGFQRIDHFIVDGVSLLNGTLASPTNQPTAKNPALNTKTGFKNLVGYNIKGGINYNINDHHNVFGNIGYYSKQPFLNAVYPNNKNFLNPNLTNEKIFGAELGYGFRSSAVNLNVNVYRTSWKDRFLRRGNLNIPDPNNAGVTFTNAYANIAGITEIHRGVEVDGSVKVNQYLSFTGMVSVGDWYYEGNATGTYFTETNEEIAGTSFAGTTLYLDKVKVGGSAQNTYAAGFVLEPAKNFKLDGTYRYVNNLYANVNPINFQSQAAGNLGALKLPSFGLFDLGASYKVNLNAKQYFTLRANVYNVFDKVYIAESNTNYQSNLSAADYAAYGSSAPSYTSYVQAGEWNGVSQQNQVFFGFGRTWAATFSFNF